MTKKTHEEAEPGKEVVDWKAKMAARVQEVKDDEQPAVVQMSLAGGMMSILDQPLPNNEVDGVILLTGVERSWYDRPYDPSDKSPPDCYSQKLGTDDAFNPTMVPADNVPEPPAKTCAECPNSKMGSAPNGRGPACKTRRRMVVAPAGVVDRPDTLGKQIMLVNVPPTSATNYSKYVNQLAASGVPPEAVVTKIKYQPSKKTLHEMVFSPVDQIKSDDALSAIFGKAASFANLITAGYSYDEESQAPGSKKF